jgi:hypothetical protein
MGKRKGACRVWIERPEGKNHLGDLGVDGSIILKCFSKKWDQDAWIGLLWLRIGTGGGRLWRQ